MQSNDIRTYWNECEQVLFAGGGIEPSMYQRTILAIRAAADGLKDISTHEALVGAWDNWEVRIKATASERGLTLAGLPVLRIAGAGFLLRARELDQFRSAQARRECIHKARYFGMEWAILDEDGDIYGGPYSAWRRTEMHLRSGYAILSAKQFDLASGVPKFVVSVTRMEPASGILVDPEPGIADWLELAAIEVFVEECAKLRARIEAMATG